MALWQDIATTLRAEIARGDWRPGDRLPTEADLSTRFGVNRHTVRRALADLSDAGIVHARRGAGVYVALAPTDYALGRRVRFHQNVTAMGRAPSRRFTRSDTRPATAKEAEALALSPGDPVHVIEGLSLADGEVLAAFRSVFPAARFPGLPQVVLQTGSITLALNALGLPDYTRAQTRLTAKLAPALLAASLQVRPGAPILRSVAINIGPDGQPVEFGTTWFAGDRVALTVTPE